MNYAGTRIRELLLQARDLEQMAQALRYRAGALVRAELQLSVEPVHGHESDAACVATSGASIGIRGGAVLQSNLTSSSVKP